LSDGGHQLFRQPKGASAQIDAIQHHRLGTERHAQFDGTRHIVCIQLGDHTGQHKLVPLPAQPNDILQQPVEYHPPGHLIV
jgi:hypothetical protein